MNSADLLKAKYYAEQITDHLLLAWNDAQRGDNSTFYQRSAFEDLEKLAKLMDLELVPAADIQGVR